MKDFYCVDCGKKSEPAPAKWDGKKTLVGFMACPCGSKDQFGHNHFGIYCVTTGIKFDNLKCVLCGWRPQFRESQFGEMCEQCGKSKAMVHADPPGK